MFSVRSHLTFHLSLLSPDAEKDQGQPCWIQMLTSPHSAAIGWLLFTFLLAFLDQIVSRIVVNLIVPSFGLQQSAHRAARSEWADPSSSLHLPHWLTSNKSDMNCSGITSVPDLKYPAWIQRCDLTELPLSPTESELWDDHGTTHSTNQGLWFSSLRVTEPTWHYSITASSILQKV